jgi:4-amino-4-deoxy-L-arabinose transferase-like glycosyltransferase
LHPTRVSAGSRTPIVQLVVIVVALLAPFVNRPFHIDDPLFIWAARNIQVHPADPYAFTVNWYGTEMPMAEVTKNPPLASYYIAIAASLFGWSEAALHIASMLPALLVAIGTYLLARRLCANPLPATLAAICTPVFVVSSVTVMGDVLMVAFWVFAVYLWTEGLDANSHVRLALASALVAASALTKYFGMTLIPLLLLYSVARQRRLGTWVWHFGIPVAVLAWYQWITGRLYGRGLLFDAASYATEWHGTFEKLSLAKVLVALAFTGGCLASVVVFTRQLWSRSAIVAGVAIAAVLTVVVASASHLGRFVLPVDRSARWLLAAQVGTWATAGLGMLVLSTLDLQRRRDAEALLLCLWIVGTFLFAGFVNWTTNGRSILPMIIPTGILISRRLETNTRSGSALTWRRTAVPLAAAAILSFLVAWADTSFAIASRTAASRIRAAHSDRTYTLWFQGHWGFQYYMEQLGAKAIDVTRSQLRPGDVVAVPGLNSNVYPMPPERTRVLETFDLPTLGWLATMNLGVGAGFYTDEGGPLPFAVGPVQPERFAVLEIRQPTQ